MSSGGETPGFGPGDPHGKPPTTATRAWHRMLKAALHDAPQSLNHSARLRRATLRLLK